MFKRARAPVWRSAFVRTLQPLVNPWADVEVGTASAVRQLRISRWKAAMTGGGLAIALSPPAAFGIVNVR